MTTTTHSPFGCARTDAETVRGPAVEVLDSGAQADATVEGPPWAWPTDAIRCELSLGSSAQGVFELQVRGLDGHWQTLGEPISVVGGSTVTTTLGRPLMATKSTAYRVAYRATHATSRATAWLTPVLED